MKMIPLVYIAIIFQGLILSLATEKSWAHGGTHSKIEKVLHILEQQPQNVEQWTTLSTLYYQEGKLNEASDAAKKALALKPGYMPALYSLAVVSLELEDYVRTETVIKQYLKKVKESKQYDEGRAWEILGDTYRNTQRKVEATEAYKTALQYLNPVSPKHYIQLAETYQEAGPAYTQQSFASIEQGINRLGPLASLLDAAVQIAEKSRQPETALTYINQAIQQQPQSPYLIFKKAKLLQQYGRSDEAKATIEELEKLWHTLPARQKSHARAKQLEAEIEAFKKLETSFSLADEPVLS